VIYDDRVNNPFPFLADAILPSLVLIWPIAIVLLLPIVAVEAQYARKRLNLSFGQAFRVFAVANVASAVIGLPIATMVAGAVQNKIEVHFFGTRQTNLDQWSHGGGASNLARSLGQYPRWTLIAAAALMFVVCFLISWWVEAAYVKWWIARRESQAESVMPQASRTVRNANLLSYALVTAISLGILALL